MKEGHNDVSGMAELGTAASEASLGGAPGTPTLRTILDGAVLGSPSSKSTVERIARALGWAGYASAVWPVDATLGVLSPTYLYLPPALTASRSERFARPRADRERMALAAGLAQEIHHVLLLDDPISGGAPGPAWLTGLSLRGRPLPPSALGDADLRASAYVALRAGDRTFGVLGVAAPRLTASDLRITSAIAAQLAIRLEFARMQRPVPLVVDRQQAVRLLEEITQPLTALVARAEVAMDVVRHGPLGELPDHLQAMRDSAQRLAAWTDATQHLLDDLPSGLPIRSIGTTRGVERPAARP